MYFVFRDIDDARPERVVWLVKGKEPLVPEARRAGGR
jgi:hypothetical protein